MRCGASLIQPVKKEVPKEVAHIPEATQATTREALPSAGTHKEAPAPKPEGITTNGGLAKPSSIQSDRMRTAKRHGGMTEFEKAKVAFNRADQVGIEEGDGAIVETRMLRASEVRELMDSLANSRDESITQAQEPMIQPERPPQRTPETGIPPGITPQPIDSDIAKANSMPVNQPAPVSQLPPKAAPRMEPQGSETGFPPKAPSQAMPPLQASAPFAEVSPPPVAPRPVVESAASVQTQEVESEIESLMARIHDPEYLNDSKLGPMLLEHKIIHNEMKQIESELGSVRVQQDAEVLKYHNSAETKRIQYETLKGQLEQAKQELIDAGKEYYESENRKKKEVTGREKQLKKLQKRISKSEAAIDKRIRELDSSKEKPA